MKLKNDNRGAVWAWVIALVFMFTYAVIWFTAGWAAMEVVSTVESQNDFNSQQSGVIVFLKNVFAWHPIIVFIGLILYGLVYSQRRDVRFDV